MVFKYYFEVRISFYKFSVSCCMVYLMHVASRMLAVSGTDLLNLYSSAFLVSVCSADMACKGLIFSMVIFICGVLV